MNDTVLPSNNTQQNFDEEHDFQDEQQDINTWTASGPMLDLPTEVYVGNSLDPTIRKQILQAEPRNKAISFLPLKMEQRMLSNMSKTDKETDKNFSKLLYRFSSVIRPIDNTLRMVYAAKPVEESGESYEAWLQLEQSVLNSRALALDALSFGNDLRRELALKTLSPNYKKPSNQRGVFGDDLSNLVQEENELNKLFNDAAHQKRRSQQNFQQRTSSPSFPLTFRPSQRNTFRGRFPRSTSWRPRFQNQGNFNTGGPSSTRQRPS